jgi:hypothetical protein
MPGTSFQIILLFSNAKLGVADSGDEKGARCLELRSKSSCFSATQSWALLILEMKRVLDAWNFVPNHPAFQQRQKLRSNVQLVAEGL